jgi:hypothetical protein
MYSGFTSPEIISPEKQKKSLPKGNEIETAQYQKNTIKRK